MAAKHHAHPTAHHKSPHRQAKHLSRQEVSYVIAALGLLLVFLVALIGVLSGRFRPFAAGLPAASMQAPLMQYQTGGQFLYLQGNGLGFELAPVPVIAVPLQGLKQSAQGNRAYSGTITIYNNSLKLNSDPIGWTSTGYQDPTHLSVPLNNAALVNALDTVPGNASLRLIVKPQSFLAVELATSNIDAPAPLPIAPAGDWNNDNIIDGGDFSLFTRQYNKSASSSNNSFDINGDGKIDGGDFSLFGRNYLKSGAR